MPWGVVAAVGGAVVAGAASKSAAAKGAAAQDRATAANAYQGEIALDQYEDYKGTYRPLEHSLVEDAASADSPEAYDKAAADAQSTVSSQLGLASERLARTPGLDPSSAAAQAANANLALKGAAMGAAAQNGARQQVQDKAFARKLDAVGLGKGLVAGASSGLASAASTAQSAANAQMAQANSTASGIGAAVGGIATAASKADWGKLGSALGVGGTTPANPGASADGYVHWDKVPATA